MNQIDRLYGEYNELKSSYLKNNSMNLREDLKNKLIELDYEINKDYENKLNTEFSMTTTLDKEEVRLEKLINFIKEKKDEQQKLINDYKKLTGLNIELSYLKYSDNLNIYKQRLELVRKFLIIKNDIIKAKELNSESKLKLLKNKLMKKEMLNLLYEFCLIDSLDINDIDLTKIIEEKSKLPKEDLKQEVVKKEEKIELPKEEIKLEVVQEAKKEEVIENKILTSMPKIDKLGTVSPVNIFESIKKAEEKLPDVVIPSNGLTEENTEIFIDTEKYFN